MTTGLISMLSDMPKTDKGIQLDDRYQDIYVNIVQGPKLQSANRPGA